MFTRAIGRERGSVSNFEIRESEQKDFFSYTGRWWVSENKRSHFSKHWPRGRDLFQASSRESYV